MQGETRRLFTPEFNGSLQIEARPERLSSEAGAILQREVLERLGIIDWLVERLHDPRDPALITHPLSELLRTHILLLGQGWRDQDDADRLRHDSVLRLAVSDRKSISPLLAPSPGADGSSQLQVPHGLASQPTLSRLVRSLSSQANRCALNEALLELASRRIKALNRGHRLRDLTLDIDSLPVEVHGHQPGSEHNGHFHARVYHPLIATAAQTGDLLSVLLREGNVHTAEGSLEFILPLIDRVERDLCRVAAVRFDAGFPDERLLGGLEQRKTHYVARLKNNAVLDRMAAPYLTRPPGRPPLEPRTWWYEMTYRAGSWTRDRRVVLVVMEREGELLLHHFWLVTSYSWKEKPGSDLLDHYRERGTAEGYWGELMTVLAPALSSSPRQKTHYRNEIPTDLTPPCNSFAHNETLLLLNAIAYNVLHVGRVLIERVTGDGWSLGRFRERLLRVASRMVVHSRRAVLILEQTAVELWNGLWKQLGQLRLAES
jgi:hypothetical protein